MAYEQHLTRGTMEKIKIVPVEDGKLRFAADQGRIFLDLENERIEFTDIIQGMTSSEIRSLESPLPKLYLASDTFDLMFYHREEWNYVCGGGYDKLNQEISSTYIKNIYYNDDMCLVFVRGDGTEITVPSSDYIPETLNNLLDRLNYLEEKIEILELNN